MSFYLTISVHVICALSEAHENSNVRLCKMKAATQKIKWKENEKKIQYKRTIKQAKRE